VVVASTAIVSDSWRHRRLSGTLVTYLYSYWLVTTRWPRRWSVLSRQ